MFKGAWSLPKGAGATLEQRGRFALNRLVRNSEGLQLVPTSVSQSAQGDGLIRFAQLHQGVPVVGANATVRVTASNVVTQVGTTLQTGLPASVSPTVSAADAAQRAQQRIALAVSPRDGHLVLVPTREGVKLVWAFLPVVPRELGTVPRILVDAHTGEILQVRDMALRGEAKASVYPSNPLASPALQLLPLAMAPTDAAGKLSNDYLVALNCVGDGVIKEANFNGFPLKIRACELKQMASPNAEGNYVASPTDDPAKKKESGSDTFSEVSMYYHAARIYSYFRGLQGDVDGQVVVEKPLRAIANLRLDSALASGNIQSLPGSELIPFSNAFYSPAGGGLGDAFAQVYGFNDGAMWFFQGPKKDYAYDGDVIYHEFIHAVVNATLQLGQWAEDKYGLTAAPGSMNEGLADYFAAAVSGDADLGEYAARDIDARMKSIRTLANKDRCPTEIVGEVHYDSTLFSGALWSARSALASDEERRTFDSAIYEVMRQSPGLLDPTYEEVSRLFVDNLKIRMPAGAKLLEESLTERGVFPECTRVVPYKGIPLTPPRASGMPGYAAPGKQNLMVSGEMAPGVLQLSSPIPERATKLTVTFSIPKGRGGIREGGSGGGPFGGGGKPFTPVVLVKWGDFVEWTSKTKLASNADAKLKPVQAGQTYSAEVEVPEGATKVAVQVANAGDEDGFYADFALAIESLPPVAPATEGPTEEPPTPTTAPAVASVADPASPKESGCGCTVPRRLPTDRMGLGVLVGLALVGLRRRRRSPGQGGALDRT
jgi:hypothetical protein